jgi:hypothetical protein
MSSAPIRKYLPAILVPQDAYKFVAAVDTLICTLPVKEPPHPGSNKLGLGLLKTVLHMQYIFVQGARFFSFFLYTTQK